MESTGYVLGTNDVITSQVDSCTTKIKKRFPFNSTLKRMSVLVDSSKLGGLCVFSKGAPEIISKMLTHVPVDFEITYKYHMNKGKRVLALAYRVLGNTSSSNKDSLQMKRDEIEKNLQFAGFLIFDCEMKPDSKSVMKELVASNHKVIMITGDSPFTACEVARKLGMLRSSSEDDKNSPVLNLSIDAQVSGGKEGTPLKQLNWSPIDDSVSSSSEMVPFSLLDSSLQSLSSNFKLCVSGSALSHLKSLDTSENSYFNKLKQISPYISVFARVSPIQKEDIILALNNSGLTTLMVGDGTNDVGALKAAHVGVSIVNDPEFESRIDNIKNSKQKKNSNGSLNAKDRMVIEHFFF
jgi:cation-transporting ATPase 13A1